MQPTTLPPPPPLLPRYSQSPDGLTELTLTLSGDEASDILNFVLKDAATNTWWDNNGTNFQAALRPGAVLSLASKVELGLGSLTITFYIYHHHHHHHHHQKAFRNKSHTSHGHRPGLKRNKSKGKRLTIN